MSTDAIRGLASIIVPCSNQLAFTKQCIAALKSHTRRPWELVGIDNGSTDHTDIYLAGVQDGAAVPVVAIANTANLGFPAAINQGLKAARGEYLVLLNNDVVVTDGWLDQLVALANSRRGREEDFTAEHAERKTEENGERGIEGRRSPAPKPIGLVGPMSNYATPPQLVENVPYHDLRAMHAFARRWRDEHRGKWFAVQKLSGFCLLMKRAVYEKIGGLDERFGIGFFDDDDLAERARRAGFKLVVAHDLFIHHFGSRTFQGNGIDAEKLLDENARRFAAKWGLAAADRKPVALRPWSGLPGFFAESQRAFACEVDEGGEEDLTQSRKDAKNANGAESGAGNGEHGKLRTDESISAQGVSGPPVSSSSVTTRLGERCSSPGDESDGPVSCERAGISLTMIVRDEQENLPNCLESVRGIFDEIVVVDTGSVDRTKEIAREFGAKVFDFVWIDDFAAARNEALSHATCDYAFWLDADDVIDPGQRDALIARVHQMMGNSQEALRTCVLGLKLDPEDAELWFRKAVVHRHRGESAEAERSWRRILDLKRPDQFCSFDQGIYGHLTRRNLAALAAERGDLAGAERLWREVLAECPGDREALAKLQVRLGAVS